MILHAVQLYICRSWFKITLHSNYVLHSAEWSSIHYFGLNQAAFRQPLRMNLLLFFARSRPSRTPPTLHVHENLNTMSRELLVLLLLELTQVVWIWRWKYDPCCTIGMRAITTLWHPINLALLSSEASLMCECLVLPRTPQQFNESTFLSVVSVSSLHAIKYIHIRNFYKIKEEAG